MVLWLHKIAGLLQGFVGLWVWVVVAGFAGLLPVVAIVDCCMYHGF